MELKDDLPGQFQSIYDGTPWYGNSICSTLRNISPETAFRRLQVAAGTPANVHTIAELVAHMISWKQVLIDRLAKNEAPKPRQRETFLTDQYGADPDTAWPRLKLALEEQHKQLMELLHEAISKGARRTPERLIRGVMQHDLYHLGQIALLKKALK